MEAEENQKYFLLKVFFFFPMQDFTLDFCSLVSFLSGEELGEKEKYYNSVRYSETQYFRGINGKFWFQKE